jgi:hypothetical protein
MFVPILLYLNSNFLSNKIALYSKNYPLLYSANNYFYKFMDSFNPFVSELNLASKEITNIDINISKGNFNRLKRTIEDSYDDLSYTGLPYMSSNNNPWVDAKLLINDLNYNGKLKFHGNNSAHFLRLKKSFSIKLSEDTLYKNVRRFGLLVMNEASIPSMFSYKVQEIFLGYKAHVDFVKVSINGINQGLYFFEEKVSKELLEKNGLSGYDLIRPYDEKDHQYNSHHIFPYMWNVAYTDLKNFSKKKLGQLLTYEKLHQTNDINLIKSKLDLHRLAKTEAIRTLFNDPTYGDNESFLYNTSTGKFSSNIRIENGIVPFKKIGGRVNFDQNLYLIGEVYRNEIFINLIQDDDFRFRRNQQLWRILSMKEMLLDLYQNMLDEYGEIILSDPTHHNSGKTILYSDTKKFDQIRGNFDYIKDYLDRTEYSIVKANDADQNKIIIFENDSNVPLRIKGKGVDKIIAAKIDSDLMPVKNIVRIPYDPSITGLEVINLITGKKSFNEI